MRARHTQLSRGNAALPRRPANRRSRRHAQQIEALEDRRLLSNIVWTNPFNPAFEADFGPNADIARAIVRQAIQDWEQLIVDFGFTKVGQPGYAPNANTFDLGIDLTNPPDGAVSELNPATIAKDRELDDFY